MDPDHGIIHGGQGQLTGRPRTTPMQYPWRGAASLGRHGYGTSRADNTILWKQQQLHYLSIYNMPTFQLYCTYFGYNVNSYTLEKQQQRQLYARVMHFSAFHLLCGTCIHQTDSQWHYIQYNAKYCSARGRSHALFKFVRARACGSRMRSSGDCSISSRNITSLSITSKEKHHFQ